MSATPGGSFDFTSSSSSSSDFLSLMRVCIQCMRARVFLFVCLFVCLFCCLFVCLLVHCMWEAYRLDGVFCFDN